MTAFVQTLTLAARNLTRNGRRTGITLLGLTLGVAAALVLQAFVAGIFSLLGGVVVQGRTGAIQVHRAGHLQADQDALKFTLPYDEALMARIAKVPGVKAVAPRMTFEATIGNGNQSTLALVTAVDPARDGNVCPARYANEVGRPVKPDDKSVAVLGLKLADGLRAKNGDELQLLASGESGQPNLLDIKLIGKIPAATEIDARRLVITTLVQAQELLQMPGRVTEYAVALDRDDRADEMRDVLQAELGKDYQVVSWLDLLPQIRSVRTMLRAVLRSVVGVLLLLLVTAVANTMLMSVMERTREIGTMLALGMKREAIGRLLLMEASVLGGLGTLLGMSVGLGVVQVLFTVGVTFRPPGADVPSTMHPDVDMLAVVVTVAIAFVGTVLAGVGPAKRAAKLSPAECLRSV